MTGDETQDLAMLTRHYADKQGLHPEQASTIAFRRAAAAPKPAA
jgi:hypothetical protein